MSTSSPSLPEKAAAPSPGLGPLHALHHLRYWLGRTALPLSEPSLLAAASRWTGLSDWGPDPFRPGLQHLLHAFEAENPMNLMGRLRVRFDTVRFLANRLRVQDLLTRQPEIEGLPVSRPLFIVGFPRTGTTLLHNLLVQAPGSRAPRFFELLWPAPPKEVLRGRPDPRIRRAAWMLRQGTRLAPELDKIHPLRAEAAEECVPLFQQAFASLAFHTMADVPGYADWLLQQDMIPAYRYHRKLLQVMQWTTPGGTWVLKSPFHLFSLDALLDVYPDACLIQTHRDPRQVLGSWCSLVAALRRMSVKQVDPKRIGRSWLELWAEGLERMMRVRDVAPASRFFDIRYPELVADPAGVVRRMYRHFEIEAPASLEADIAGWLRRNPQGKHGAHQYALQEFGLSPDLIRERFAPYIQRFDLEA